MARDIQASGRAGLIAAAALAALLPASAARAGDPKMEPEISVALSAPFPNAKAAFQEAVKIIRRDSYNAALDEEIIYFAALKGVLRHLSPENNKDALELRNPEVRRAKDTKVTGELASIGVSVTIDMVTADRGHLIVSDVIPGSPAERAGLRLRDRIAVIDGDPLGGKGLSEAEAMLHRRAGTKIKLELERAGARFVVELSCEKIRAQDVRAETLRGAGVLRVLAFSEAALKDFGPAADRLLAEKVRGIVLDLRGNSGGVVDVGTHTACAFLAAGATVLHTAGRDLALRASLCSQNGDTRTPLVVLVNEGTASSAEIFAAALKENVRAQVVGSKSRGAGLLKEVKYLKNEYSFTLVTDILYGPARRSWLGRGVLPDREVALSQAELERSRLEPEEGERLRRDAQLSAALALLP